MNALPLLLVIAAQAGQASPAAPNQVTAAGLISKMFGRYALDKSVAGTMRLVETAMNVSREVDVTLAYERPSCFYLDEKALDGKRSEIEITSDGINFTYTKQATIFSKSPKLMESVHPANGRAQTVPDLYTFRGLTSPPRYLPLDVAVGSTRDLVYVKQQLLSFTLRDKESVNGRDAYRIDGQWADQATHPAEGYFALWITEDGDLVRFTKKMNFAVSATWLHAHKLPLNMYPNGVETDSVWDVNLKVDQPVNHDIFRVHQSQ